MTKKLINKLLTITAVSLVGATAFADNPVYQNLDDGPLYVDYDVYSSNTAAITVTGGSLGYGTFVDAQIESGIGIFLDATQASYLNIDVDGSTLNGRAIKSDETYILLSFGNNNIWNTFGSSYLSALHSSDDLKINYTLTDINDAIYADEEVGFAGANIAIEYILADGFLEQISDGFILDIYDTFVSPTVYFVGVDFSVAEINANGSTWTATDIGNGQFEITNISIVPEPGTYAAIFGAFALGFVAYRRRKI